MKKISVKRIVAATATILSAVIVAVTLGVIGSPNTANGLNCSEAFTGYVSEDSYPTRDETARAFVEEQLGETDAAKFSDFEVSGALTDGEIESINGSPAARTSAERITGGEHCVISYTLSDRSKRIKTDILSTDENRYLYFARLPETGEQPTKAYLDSVFDGKKYLNCTIRSSISVSQLNANPTTYLQTIYLDGDKAYFNQELPGFVNEIYLREGEEKIVPYLRSPIDDDGKFYSINEINARALAQGLRYEVYLTKGGERVNIDRLDSMADVADFAFSMEMDCSYFIKTDYGFAMTDDKFKEACRALAGNEFADEFDRFWHDYRVCFRADYYVSEGRLGRVDVSLQMAYENDLLAFGIVTDYFGFGSTEIEFPRD